MLINEQELGDDKTLVVKKTYDFTPVEKQVQLLRETGAVGTKENWLVGRIPGPLMANWIKEAGLDWSDREAVRDLVRKKLLSGEYNSLRPRTESF